MWIIQEIAWASNPAVGVEDDFETSFQQLEMAAYHLESMLKRDPTLPGHMMEADSSLEDVEVKDLAFARKIFYFRHLTSRADAPFLLHWFDVPADSPGFLQCLLLTRDFQATEPKDKLFALWNVAKDKKTGAGLEYSMDYSKPLEAVYADFAAA